MAAATRKQTRIFNLLSATTSNQVSGGLATEMRLNNRSTTLSWLFLSVDCGHIGAIEHLSDCFADQDCLRKKDKGRDAGGHDNGYDFCERVDHQSHQTSGNGCRKDGNDKYQNQGKQHDQSLSHDVDTALARIARHDP